jgi:bifunctional N-acetylglucosamine-1-phosphate-uridyltransferase/glucosamine-1-phosphate-acetyltransferase GlmU-like protein
MTKAEFNNNKADSVAVIILAAGLGTRMKSDLAKVLHPILGRPMIRYVLKTAARYCGPQCCRGGRASG